MYARERLPTSLQISVFISTLLLSLGTCSELRVLVRLNDGQIAEEVLQADSEKDIISLEFKQGDGALITFLADFKRHVKILRALVLGEPERGQTQYQALCFITRLDLQEIIPSEAMARLRQKKPQVVRTAEERRAMEELSMDVAVNLSLAWRLSTHIHNVCREARELVYTRETDVKYWLGKGVDGSMFKALPQKPDRSRSDHPACPAASDPWQACVCRYQLRVEWYPCLLKYCRGHGPSPYKCGIRSCSKAYRFHYHTPHKRLCHWDEEAEPQA